MITIIYMSGIFFGLSIGLTLATFIIVKHELQEHFRRVDDDWEKYCKKNHVDTKVYKNPKE